MTIMTHTTKQLEARLARVERELAELRDVVKVRPTLPWYRRIVGDYAGDPAFQEILRLGRLIRSGKRKR
jgi:hypothetical protein